MQDAPAPSVHDQLRLRIGVGVVDVAMREIAMPGARGTRRVTPKAMMVLRLLAEAQGRVISRNDLLARAWPDTLPTDDVLTQAVTQLRKAFGSGSIGAAEGRRYIETIAKTGYRLTVPVEVLKEAVDTPSAAADARQATPAVADPTAAPTPGMASVAAVLPESVAGAPATADVLQLQSSGGGRRDRLLLMATAALLVFAVALGLLLAVRQTPSGVSASGVASTLGTTRPYRLITTATGFELSPTLSPDASMIAYSASENEPGDDAADGSSAILVQATRSAAPRQLTHPAPGVRDEMPAWSPDGRELAFARRLPDGGCRIMLVAVVSADDARELVRCDGSELLSFSWVPDGSALLFGTMTGDRDGSGIRRLDLASGRWQPLAYEIAAGSLDYRPQYSPDGKWIVFVRNPQLGDLWRIPADGGRAEQLTRVGAEIRGWSWLGDGELVFGKRVDNQVRLYSFEIGSGAMRDLGIDDAQSPVVSRRGDMLAFVHRNPEFGIYRVDPRTSDGPVRVFESSGRDSLPTVSPDGRQLVFASDRAGVFELWWADLTHPESLRPIEHVRPDTRQAPVWSSDGATLLVAALRDDDTPVIYELAPATGAVSELPVPSARPRLALYAGDKTRIAVLDEALGSTRLTLYDRSSTPWRALGAINGVSNAHFDAARGKFLFTRLDSDGLWEVGPDLAHSQTRAVAEVPSRWRYRSWAVVDGGISYLHAGSRCRSQLRRVSLAEGGPSAPACIAALLRSAVNGFSAEPGSGVTYLALAETDGTDIAIMAAPRKPESHAGNLAKWLNGLIKPSS